MGGALWKPWEVDYLCRWYGIRPIQHLTMKLRRNKGAVWAKAYGLGLSKSHASKRVTDEQYIAAATDVATERRIRLAAILGGDLARRVTSARHEVWARLHDAGAGPAGIRDASGFDHGTVCAALKRRRIAEAGAQQQAAE